MQPLTITVVETLERMSCGAVKFPSIVTFDPIVMRMDTTMLVLETHVPGVVAEQVHDPLEGGAVPLQDELAVTGGGDGWKGTGMQSAI